MKICGIDEAGRGPVIGPLVIAGVCATEKEIEELKKLGVKDSKLLTPKKREGLFEQIKKIKHALIVVSPQEIDDAVESETLNLNKLEAIKSAEILNKLSPESAILDCPSTNTESYQEFLKSHLSNKLIRLKVEHKADTNYTVVGAASILAKVTRDREIEKIKKACGDCGSGYPSDPVTVEFVKKYYKKYPMIIRHSWQTIKDLESKKKQKTLSDY